MAPRRPMGQRVAGRPVQRRLGPTQATRRTGGRSVGILRSLGDHPRGAGHVRLCVSGATGPFLFAPAAPTGRRRNAATPIFTLCRRRVVHRGVRPGGGRHLAYFVCLPSPFGRAAGFLRLPSPFGRGAGFLRLPSPFGRGAGGEGGVLRRPAARTAGRGNRRRGCSAFRPHPNLSQRERGPICWLWGLLLVGCLLAAHTVYWTDMRMRAPAMPVIALAAAAGLRRREKNV